MSNPADNEAMGIHNMNTALFSVKEDNDTGQSSQGKLPQTSERFAFRMRSAIISTFSSGICCVGFEKET